MSEEILKALMQLFAIILKQDGGVEENEISYVRNFLKSQLGEKGTDEYFNLFIETAEMDRQRNIPEKKLTSVHDSVRILGICRKINKTLSTSQKYVVLVRLFELMAADKKLTKQRLSIINTVSEVFNISRENYDSVETFVLISETGRIVDPNILYFSSHGHLTAEIVPYPDKKEVPDLAVLRIPEVNLYFIKHFGHCELYLNGLGVHKNRIYLLAKGSTLKLSRGKPLYYSDITDKFIHSESQNKIFFEVEDLSYSFRNGSRGLNGISLTARHGNMIAIMGSSGAGKTTLLNVLAGINKPGSGHVRVNGLDLHSNNEELSGSIGYIPQDDLLIEELTVFENLYYNARFCFGDINDDEIRQKVNTILENLGLASKKDLKVGSPLKKSISGGQRKRLNIALELIREPSVLFVDEPTSGLSSRDSENVMDLLRELTLKGKLIFVVIHQPSSEIFKMFDKVAILDTGGVMVYYGNPVEAVMYFKKLDDQINADVGECPVCGNVNPELIFNIIEAHVVDEFGNYTRKRKIEPPEWEKYYKIQRSRPKKTDVTDPPVRNLVIPGWITQVYIYFRRDFKSKISNLQYVLLSLLEAPLLAFILAYIIKYIADPASEIYRFRENENIPIYIFMALIVAVFIGLTQSAEEIFKDRKILKREHFLHLSRSGYLVSKIFILFLISAIQSFFFVLIANNILELKSMFLVYWFALFTTAAFANMLGLNISAIFNSAITIYIVIPLLIIPMMVLSGAMFSFEKLNRNISRIDKVPLLAELMPTRWSYEALMVNQFKNNKFQVNFYELDKNITNSDFKLSYYLPELENRLQKVRNETGETDPVDKTRNDLALLRNEILGEAKLIDGFDIPDVSTFDPGSFTPEKANQIENSIHRLEDYYSKVFSANNQAKTNKVNNLIKNLKDTYYSYLDTYYNESVSDQVRKIYEKKKLVEFNNSLVRLSEPVYLDPVPENKLGFRTHFFAPRKYFLGKYYETYNFNMAFIWILTLILYVNLYILLIKRGFN